MVPQAIAAVNQLNGADLGGRRISVREDREDRDVKQFTEGEEGGGSAPRRGGGGRRGRGRGPRPPVEGEPSGFQVSRQHSTDQSVWFGCFLAQYLGEVLPASCGIPSSASMILVSFYPHYSSCYWFTSATSCS